MCTCVENDRSRSLFVDQEEGAKWVNFLLLTRILCLPGLCDVTFVVLVHFVVGVPLYFVWDAGAWCFSECLSGSLRGDVLRVDLASQPIPLQHLYFSCYICMTTRCASLTLCLQASRGQPNVGSQEVPCTMKPPWNLFNWRMKGPVVNLLFFLQAHGVKSQL